MASESNQSTFNILGSSELNTDDGKNPVSASAPTTSDEAGKNSGQESPDADKKEFSQSADVPENRLGDEEETKGQGGGNDVNVRI